MSPKELSRAQVIRAARKFRWTKKMPRWTVIVEGRELPARPLVLEAAGVQPNDSTNSHQAVAILKMLGFETRYRESAPKDGGYAPASEASRSKGLPSVVELAQAIAAKVPDEEWEKLPRDFARNIDHYLYGAPKKTD